MTDNLNQGRKRQLRDNVFWICLLSAILLVAGEMLPVLIGPSAQGQPPLRKTIFEYITFWGIWASTLFTIFAFQKNRWIAEHLTPKRKGNRVSMLLLGLLVGGLLNGFCALIAHLHGDFQLSFVRFEPIPILLLLFAVFVQSSAEELLCRGFVYQRLLKGYGARFAIVVNAALFGLLHAGNDGINALAIYDLFITGVFFSLIVYYFDSLWMAMTLHTAWNFTQNILLGLPNSGYRPPYSIFRIGEHTQHSFAYDPAFGLEGTVLASLLMTVCCVALYLWKGRTKKATPEAA